MGIRHYSHPESNDAGVRTLSAIHHHVLRPCCNICSRSRTSCAFDVVRNSELTGRV